MIAVDDLIDHGLGLADPDDTLTGTSLVEFLQDHMFIPETGAALVLEPEVRAVLEEMSRRDDDGNFLYSTWVYSAPKKSAKTTICAGIVLWHMWNSPNSTAYIIGNDLKQADSRMQEAIRYCVLNSTHMKDRARVARNNVYLDNGARIEAVPIDPEGEAGVNPAVLAWTEAWGAKQRKHETMWTEMSLSPTRAGHSFRLIESYAGHSGESNILERLYDNGVKEGTPHPTIPELYIKGAQVTYWCTRRIWEWQRGQLADRYYEEQEATLPPSEYRRLHGNEWVTSEDVFVAPEWWDTCQAEQPDKHGPVVVAMDAGVNNDCFAIVTVSRDKEVIDVRDVHVLEPPPNGEINFDDAEQYLRGLLKRYRVVEVAIDPYQLKDMAQRLKRARLVKMHDFNQGAPRLTADKALHDRIRDGRLRHYGDDTLTAHIKNANRKTDGAEGKLRIVKRNDKKKIDAAVALSMAADRAAYLNIG